MISKRSVFMLQDLAFGRLDNHYEDHAPKKGDIVL